MISKISDKPLLVTTTLIGNFEWFQECPSSWKEKAFRELEGTLKRTKTWAPSPEIERGIKFEKMVNEALLQCEAPDQFKNRFPKSCMDVVKFFERCKGGLQQVSLSKTVKIGDQVFNLFGKADIVFPLQKIIDIKTTGKASTKDKYASKLQHWMYCYCGEIKNFEYIVAEFVNEQFCTNVQVYELECDLDYALIEIQKRLAKFIDWVQHEPDLLKAYVNIFTK